MLMQQRGTLGCAIGRNHGAVTVSNDFMLRTVGDVLHGKGFDAVTDGMRRRRSSSVMTAAARSSGSRQR